MPLPVHIPAGTAPAYWGPGDLYRFLVTGDQTGGSYFTLEALVPPNGGPPLHIHHREEEMFYILDGACSIQVGDVVRQAKTGDLIAVPRGVAHTYRNELSTNLKMLVTFTPAGMDQYFFKTLEPALALTTAPPDVAPRVIQRFITFAEQYGVEFVAAPSHGR